MISVVICTYNRAKYLTRSLECLTKQENVSPVDFEIVVVNNNCTDTTEEICETFEKNNPLLNFVYVKESNPGLSFARNKGIATAKGDIVSFIDDDGFARKDYLEQIGLYIQKYPDYVAYGGKVIPIYNEGKEPKWMSKYIEGIVSTLDFGDQVQPFTKKYPVGCNMYFKAEYFKKYGGFNTDLQLRSDEKYVFNKMKENGYDMLYTPEVYVNHFMDDFRVEEWFVRYLSQVVGNSERIRLKDTTIFAKFAKIIEYLLKYAASLILAIGFLFQGQLAKAKYIILVRWNVILGYFKKEVKKSKG
ncbi:MAG: glycosyltransferase involved in cell wall biosynthesis [Patiriisocius sp.]|jgi:glycosyltransferase involved in cell wall biosynthesis